MARFTTVRLNGLQSRLAILRNISKGIVHPPPPHTHTHTYLKFAVYKILYDLTMFWENGAFNVHLFPI